MFEKLIYLCTVLTVVYSNCVPDQANFYWSTPCGGVTNVFVPTFIQAYQNNQTLDSQGGLDARLDLNVVVTITNDYDKTVTTPLVDIALQNYVQVLGKCKWTDIPTFGILNNQDSCQFVNNCHMDNPPDPTQFTVSLNIDQLVGSYKDVIRNQTYYGATLTFKDGTANKLACIYIQDIMINF